MSPFDPAPAPAPHNRLGAQPSVHHLMAFGFRYHAEDQSFRPATRELVVFERGCDDDRPGVDFPWLRAGYRTPHVPSGAEGVAAVEVTNAYALGAMVAHGHGLILGIRVVPPAAVRLVSAADARGLMPTPTFPRGGGDIDGDVAAQLGDFTKLFWGAFRQGAYGELLPPNTNVEKATTFLDSVSALAVDTADHEGLSWRPAKPLMVSAAAADLHPNRMRFVFPGAVDRVTLPWGAEPPNDGDFAVLDVDVRVTVARVVWVNSQIVPFDEEDARKIEAWSNALGSKLA